MSTNVARYALIGLGAFGLVLVGATIWAVVPCFRRRWRRGRSIAASVCWLSMLVLVFSWFFIPFAVARDAMGYPIDGDASQKARVLAETISEGMNCTAHVLLSMLVAAVAWGVAAWKTKKGVSQA